MKWMTWALACVPAAAHVVSMSTGDATLSGAKLDYVLRMPLYEVAHVADAQRSLAQSMRFFGGGDEARLVSQSCREEDGNFVCRWMYLFPRDIDEFRVQCNFASITVPNHVHLLRATNGSRSDQAAFDASFTTADLRFRDPGAAEIFARQAGAGFWRALAGPAQILFLVALLLAARGWRDLGGVFGMFAAGQVAAAVLMLMHPLALSPRFIEAAAALTIAYLAVELLLIPNAGGRWIVTGLLGTFHGIYFAMLVSAGGYRPTLFLAGALAAEAMIAAILWLPVRRLNTGLVRTALSSILLFVGLGWFVMRLFA
jgi:hypothetical protein